MFENDKLSKYFFEMIFSNIDERRKLKIVQYNKKLQNKLNININNFIFFSQRIIEYHSNNYANEINRNLNSIVFKGNYANGKRNGEGNEFNLADLTFNGEYLNGKRNGEGKEYYKDKKIKFKGQYLNGKRWNGIGYDINGEKIYEIHNGKGKIKEYDFSGELIFEGEYLNGEKNGQGKEYFSEKLIFEGEYYHNLRWNGKVYSYGTIYELKNGCGYIEEEKEEEDYQIFFEGQYINGNKNGKGKEYLYNHLLYEGEYLCGKRHGKGKLYRKKELKFEGEFLYGFKFKGKEFLKGKLEFEGEFLFDKKKSGKGYDENGNIIYEINNGTGNVKIYYDDKLFYEGELLNYKKHGKGKEYNFDEELLFEGEYLNGKRWNGRGKEYDLHDELVFEGEYLKGERWNGKGKEYNALDELIFQGEYSKGEKISDIFYFSDSD